MRWCVTTGWPPETILALTVGQTAELRRELVARAAARGR